MKAKPQAAGDRIRHLALILPFAVVLAFSSQIVSADDTSATDAHAIPSIDGAIGPCSVTFAVKDGTGAPVFDSKIRVHIAYGVFHKLDLEVGTNVDGKAQFKGLPNRVKQPLQFKAEKGDREGSAVFDPAEGCRAVKAITITPAPADPDQP